MYRNDGANAGPSGSFVEGDPIAGVPPTEVSGPWLTETQEEIAGVIEGAGLVLAKGNNTQLRQAIGLVAARRNVFKNWLLNGGPQVAQRGVDSAAAGAARYSSCDRWLVYPGGGTGAARTVGQVGSTPTEQELTRWRGAMFWQQTIAASTTAPYLAQRIEGTAGLSATKVTASFFAKLTALSSGTTVVLTPSMIQNFGSGGSAAVTVLASNITLTMGGALARFSATFDLASIIGKTVSQETDYTEFRLTGPTGVTFTVSFTGLQVELGAVPTEFEVRSVAQELVLCRRYYEVSYGGTASAWFHSASNAGSVAEDRGEVSGWDAVTLARALQRPFQMAKRAAPTMVWYSPVTGAAGNIYWEGADRAVVSTNGASAASTGFPGVAVSRAGSQVRAHWTADAEL